MSALQTAGVAAIAGVFLSASPGCKGQEPPTTDQAEAQERLNVISNPSMYLEASNFAFDDEASDYEQLRAMTVSNTSGYALHGLAGDVIWLDDDGQRLGSSPFTLNGALRAHGSRTFSAAEGTMTSGTLRGGALRVTITFTHVAVGE